MIDTIKALENIRTAAYKWWVSKRPPNWPENHHRRNPLVNTTGPRERALAKAVAKELEANDE